MLKKLINSLLLFPMFFSLTTAAVDKPAAPMGEVVQMTEDEVDDDADDDMQDNEDDLPESPLVLVGGEEKNLGELNEASVVEFEVEAENIGAEEVFFKRAMSTCACLKILESPGAGNIAPGGRVKIRAQLIGSRLGHNVRHWKRWIYLETKRYSQATLEITGTFSPVIEISPDVNMFLGEFDGVDVPWVRKFVIKATNPEKNPHLTILPPKESNRFDLKLTLKDEKTREYELEIRPKLPMVPGPVNEMVFLPVPLLGKDMGVRLGIFGKVLGRRFLLSEKAIKLTREDFEDGISPEKRLIVTLIEGNTQVSTPKNPFGQILPNLKNTHKHDHRDQLKGGLHVSREERVARNTRPLDYQEKVFAEVEMTETKEVKVSRNVYGDTLVFTLKISPEILELPRKKVTLELKLKGKTQMPFDIEVFDKVRSSKGKRRVGIGNEK